MKNNLNNRFILALNKEASIYEAAEKPALESVEITEKDCIRKIESSQTWQSALIAFLECVPTITTSEKAGASINTHQFTQAVDMWRFIQTLSSLERVLTRTFAGWLADAVTAIQAGAGIISNHGPWSMFLNILCSDSFKRFWDEIGTILDRYAWLVQYWQENLISFFNYMSNILADVIVGGLDMWNLSPNQLADFDEQLKRFFRQRLKNMSLDMEDNLERLCETVVSLQNAFNAMGATPEQREKAWKDLWENVSKYVMGLGGVVLDTVENARNAVAAFASSVAQFIRNNQEALKIGALISFAIAAAVAAVATGGAAAPALAAAVLAFAAILNIDLEGWTQESIQSAIERNSV